MYCEYHQVLIALYLLWISYGLSKQVKICIWSLLVHLLKSWIVMIKSKYKKIWHSYIILTTCFLTVSFVYLNINFIFFLYKQLNLFSLLPIMVGDKSPKTVNKKHIRPSLWSTLLFTITKGLFFFKWNYHFWKLIEVLQDLGSNYNNPRLLFIIHCILI